MLENITSTWEQTATSIPSLESLVLQPHPDWEFAKSRWSFAWQLHTYGLGSLFMLLAGYSILMLGHLNRRLRYHPLLAYTALTIFVLGASRGIVLLADPYCSTSILPRPLVLVLQGITCPCLIAIFTLLELSIMRLTRVRMAPDQHTRLLFSLLLGHFALVSSIYITVALHTELKLLILLSQSIFITWGLVLCFIFVYNGFKITQFTNETSRVLQQIATYTRVKRELTKVGNHRDLALHRIRKARIRKSSTEVYPFSEASELSGAESSDSMCFFNEAHFEMNDSQLEAAFKRQKEMKTQRRHKRQRKEKRNSESSDNYVTDSASTVGVVSLEEQLLSQLQNRSIRDTIHTIGAAREGYHALAKQTAVFINEHACKQDTQVSNDMEADDDHETEVDNHEGYMADTEYTSPKVKRKHKNKSKETNEDDGDSPPSSPYPLPNKDNSLGLSRIRQGRVLRKVLKLTYVCTLLAFACCILQLYAMFGIYGVLSNETEAEPWPWITFMSFSRMSELGVGWTSALITHTLGKQRTRTARKHRTLAQESTRC